MRLSRLDSNPNSTRKVASSALYVGIAMSLDPAARVDPGWGLANSADRSSFWASRGNAARSSLRVMPQRAVLQTGGGVGFGVGGGAGVGVEGAAVGAASCTTGFRSSFFAQEAS